MEKEIYYYKKVGKTIPADHPVRGVIAEALRQLKQRYHPDMTIRCLLIADADPTDYDFSNDRYCNGFYSTQRKDIAVKMKDPFFSMLTTLAHEIRHATQFATFKDPETDMWWADIETDANRFGRDFALDFADNHPRLQEAAQAGLEAWLEAHPPNPYNRDLCRRIKRHEHFEPFTDEEYGMWGRSIA